MFSNTPEIAEMCFFTLDLWGHTNNTNLHQNTSVNPGPLRVPQYCVDAKSRQTRFGRRNQESARYYRTYHFFHNLFHILQQENLCLKDGQSRMVN
jgi:hypothetical protein